MIEYSYEELRDLYLRDPEEFEQYTTSLIDEVINSSGCYALIINESQERFEENKKKINNKEWQEFLQYYRLLPVETDSKRICAYIDSLDKEYQTKFYRIMRTHFFKANNFSYDYWRKIIEEQPEEFEYLRKRMICEFIAYCASNKKLAKQLQWQIDSIRLRAKNSLSALIEIMSLLYDTVYGENGLVEKCQSLPINVRDVWEKNCLVNKKSKIKRIK